MDPKLGVFVRLLICLFVLFSSLAVGAAAPLQAQPALKKKTGLASYYGPRFHGKCCTANGEHVNMYDLTAAHPTLPFGTRLRVTNVKNGRWVVVRVNDRGPFHGNRVIDLSLGAFKKIAKGKEGIITVRLQLAPKKTVSQPLKTPGLKLPPVKP